MLKRRRPSRQDVAWPGHLGLGIRRFAHHTESYNCRTELAAAQGTKRGTSPSNPQPTTDTACSCRSLIAGGLHQERQQEEHQRGCRVLSQSCSRCTSTGLLVVPSQDPCYSHMTALLRTMVSSTAASVASMLRSGSSPSIASVVRTVVLSTTTAGMTTG